LIAHAISDSDKQAMVQKGIELAKEGDSQMLKFFFGSHSAKRTTYADCAS
jgi:hypothetical protein